eukprot:COSAG01_NODE_2278_length_7990_cov_4.925167_2_plen_93_part_00
MLACRKFDLEKLRMHTPCTRLALRGIQYRGAVLTLAVEERTMWVEVTAADAGVSGLTLLDAGGRASSLQPPGPGGSSGAWSGPLQQVVVRAK